MEMVQVTCNICDSSEHEEQLYPVNSGTLARCKNCDLYYANPRRTDLISAIADGHTSSEIPEGKKLNYWGRILEFNRYLKLISKHKSPPGRMLDVGCCEGYFLYEARKLGWECYGVEPHRGTSDFAREWLKLDVRTSVLKEDLFDGKFDVVTAFACLEHVPDPCGVLNIIRKMVNDDGVIMVSVPTVPFYLGLVKSKWRMFIGGHYWFFTDESMSKLLRKAGFKLVDSAYVSKSVDLHTITSRLSDSWQPNNLGAAGRALHGLVQFLGIGGLRFPINLFDTKLYIAVPGSTAL